MPSQTVTIQQLAQFCDAVYGGDGVGSPFTGPGSSWSLINWRFPPSLLSDSRNGFKAQVWQRGIEDVIAFRGTVPILQPWPKKQRLAIARALNQAAKDSRFR